MTKKELALETVARLKKEYPDAGCTLEYEDAWKLLISVRLAAQCTDARVNQVVPGLYEKFPTISALADADESDIEEIKRLYSQFVQYKDIANRLGKTFNTVKEKILYLISTGELEANSYKNRLVRNIDRSGYGWTKWQDEMLIREFKKGKTLREISEMVGKSLAATKTRNQTLTKRIIQGLEI